MSIKEGASCTLVLTFKDENGDEVTPTSASYKINELRSNDVILADTDIVIIGSVHNLEITGEQNEIINQGYQIERHEVTVSFNYSTNKNGKNSYILEIKNLRFVT